MLDKMREDDPYLEEAEAFFKSREKWSFETFGPPTDRGPIGPLTHLAKEVDEAVAEVSALETAWPSSHASQKTKLLEELVDCTFLVQDAVSRAGFTYAEFMDACWAKLDKNMKRKWGPKSADGVVEHIRE